MTFDPKNPIPRRTLFEIEATGVGQASNSRLWAALAIGVVLALALFIVTDAWWLGCWPLALAAFALFGVAAKATQALDIRHAEEPVRRTVLRLIQVAAVTIGTLSVLVGAVVLTGMTLEWEWLIAVVEG